MSQEQLEEMGPIDYEVLEWPGELPTTGEVRPLLMDLSLGRWWLWVQDRAMAGLGR